MADVRQPNEITEAKIKALVNSLYAEYAQKWGTPRNPLKQVVVGRLDIGYLGMCTQLLGKSHIAISSDFIGTVHTHTLLDLARHELAHLFAGVEHQHDKEWVKWAKRFGAKYNGYL